METENEIKIWASGRGEDRVGKKTKASTAKARGFRLDALEKTGLLFSWLALGGFAGSCYAEGESEKSSDKSGRLGDFAFKGVLNDSVLVDPGEVSRDTSNASHFAERTFERGVDVDCSPAGEGGRGAG